MIKRKTEVNEEAEMPHLGAVRWIQGSGKCRLCIGSQVLDLPMGQADQVIEALTEFVGSERKFRGIG